MPPRDIRVPQDIVSHIVEHFKDDTRILQILARVSPVWLHESRRRLMRRMIVEDRGSTFNFGIFVRCLERRPALRPYLKELQFFGERTVLDIARVAAMLPHLKKISLHFIILLPSSAVALDDFARSLSKPLTIPSLELSGCPSLSGDHCWDPVLSLLGVFSRIGELSISGSWVKYYSHFVVPEEGFAPRLWFTMSDVPRQAILPQRKGVVGKFDFSAAHLGGMDPFASLFPQYIRTDILRHLSLTLIPNRHRNGRVYQVIIDACRGVTHLSLDIGGITRLKPLSLVNLKLLESVTLVASTPSDPEQCNYGSFKESWSKSFMLLMTMVPTFRNPFRRHPLSKVQINVNLYSEKYLHWDENESPSLSDVANWSELELALESFTQLQGVEIVYFVPGFDIPSACGRYTVTLPVAEKVLTSVRSQLQKLGQRCQLIVRKES